MSKKKTNQQPKLKDPSLSIVNAKKKPKTGNPFI